MENILENKLNLRTDFAESNVIDSSEKQKSYLVVTETGKHLKVSPTSYFLLESFEKGVSVQDLAKMLDVSEEKIVSSYESLKAKINELDKNETNKRQGFWFLWEIIPSKVVNVIARPFSVMFNPIIAVLSCLLILTGILLSVQVGTFSGYSAIQNPQAFWIGYLLFLLSTFFHEFGHASASVRYGATPSGIGFTLYLIFPALYSDVTTAWKLKSWQRAIVGLGGIYFQLIVAAIFTLFGIIFENDSFKVATLMIFANCILNLNPFFKFDGYWILSDLLGVVNLSQQPKQIILFLYNRLRGDKSANLPWKWWISLLVGIYSIGSIFIIGIFVWFYSSYFWNGIAQYPIAFQEFFKQIISGSITFSETHKFFISTASMIIFIYFLYNIALKPLFYKSKNFFGEKQ